MWTKEGVRTWLQDRNKARKPLPDAKTIRRQIERGLIEADHEAQSRKEFPVPIDPIGYKA